MTYPGNYYRLSLDQVLSEVRHFIEENGRGPVYKELAHRLNCSIASAGRYLDKLERDGRISRFHSKKSGKQLKGRIFVSSATNVSRETSDAEKIQKTNWASDPLRGLRDA